VRQLQEAASNRSPGGSSALTNKKDEDDVYDIEAAVLTGAGGSFRPLSGSLRGAVFPLNTSLVVGLALFTLRPSAICDGIDTTATLEYLKEKEKGGGYLLGLLCCAMFFLPTSYRSVLPQIQLCLHLWSCFLAHQKIRMAEYEARQTEQGKRVCVGVCGGGGSVLWCDPLSHKLFY